MNEEKKAQVRVTNAIHRYVNSLGPTGRCSGKDIWENVGKSLGITRIVCGATVGNLVSRSMKVIKTEEKLPSKRAGRPDRTVIWYSSAGVEVSPDPDESVSAPKPKTPLELVQDNFGQAATLLDEKVEDRESRILELVIPALRAMQEHPIYFTTSKESLPLAGIDYLNAEVWNGDKLVDMPPPPSPQPPIVQPPPPKPVAKRADVTQMKRAAPKKQKASTVKFPNWTPITAKWVGKCGTCLKEVDAGEKIWIKSDDKYVHHQSCGYPGDQPPLTTTTPLDSDGVH